MKNLLILLLCAIPTALHAQIVITSEDMPVVGDEITVNLANPLEVPNAALTGPDYNWDFSNLSSVGQRTDAFSSVSSTPFAYQFFFNNVFLYPDNESDFAVDVEFPSVIPQLTFEDVMYFYRNADDAYYNTGFGATINDIPASVQGNPTDTLYKFPLSFGDTNSNDFFLELEIPGFGYYGQYGTRVDTVDGWGSISLPGATYDALRVKSTMYITDTTYVDFISFGFAFERPVAIEYKWLALDKGLPVLKVTEQLGIPVTAEYIDESTPTAIIQEDLTGVYLSPNPANGHLNVLLTGNEQSIEIWELSGRLVKRLTPISVFNHTRTIDLAELKSGMYILVLNFEDRRIPLTFEKID